MKGRFPLPQHTWPQLDRMVLNSSRFLAGAGTGVRPSTRRKPAADFREHRQYVPGDEIRLVDWKASARQEAVFLKQGENPHDKSVSILIDCSPSMQAEFLSEIPIKRNTALGLTSVLGYLALSHGDRLSIHPSGTENRPLNDITGKGQFPTLLSYLRRITPSNTFNLLDEVRSLRRSHNRGGLVFILSDLLDVQRLDDALRMLPPPRWGTSILHLLSDEELHPTLQGNFELIDAETGEKMNFDIDQKALQNYQHQLAEWLGAVEKSCLTYRAFYTLIQADWSLERQIIPHLRKIRVIEPL